MTPAPEQPFHPDVLIGLQDQQVLWSGVTFVAIEKDLELVLEFTAIETGTRKRRRPQLEAALNHTRRSGGVLLIAKLDRLARFVAVDMPEADNLTIHVMTAVAEREAQWISAHTKAALAARKARGSSSANTLADQLRTLIKSGAASMKDGRLTAVPHLGETVA